MTIPTHQTLMLPAIKCADKTKEHFLWTAIECFAEKFELPMEERNYCHTVANIKLELDIIYFQAKRWGNIVRRPEIQKFAGALQGQRAKK